MSTSAKPAPAKARRISARTAAASDSRNHDGAQRARSLDDPALYINRELSLVDFQRRVLEEAQDSRNPVLERLMFLSFVGSNIDEFFMVRVAGLKRQIEKGVQRDGPRRHDAGGTVARHPRRGHTPVSQRPRLLDQGTCARPGRRRHPHQELCRPDRRAALYGEFLFPADNFSHADAAGFRSRTPVSAHLEPQLESCGDVARRRRRRALCARQDSRYPAATGSGERRGEDAKPHQGCRRKSRPLSGWSNW